MNDPSQKKYHETTETVLYPKISHTEEGYQAQCPTCPWTSGIKVLVGSVKLLYSKHLDYVGVL